MDGPLDELAASAFTGWRRYVVLTARAGFLRIARGVGVRKPLSHVDVFGRQAARRIAGELPLATGRQRDERDDIRDTDGPAGEEASPRQIRCAHRHQRLHCRKESADDRVETSSCEAATNSSA